MNNMPMMQYCIQLNFDEKQEKITWVLDLSHLQAAPLYPWDPAGIWDQ